MKIGLLGGTFDPIHEGHIALARKVLAARSLDEIWVIPSHIPPHRNEPIALPDQRYHMCKLALENKEHFVLSDIEYNRREKSFFIDTINYLKSRYPNRDFFFIIGIDAFLDFLSWKEPIKLLHECKLIVINRPGYKSEEFYNFMNTTILKDYNDSVSYLNIETPNVSSTEIREKIKNGDDVSSLLDKHVLEYINQKGLYKK